MMPYRQTPFFRGPDLTEAPPTPWWHVIRRLRWSLVRRPRRDAKRSARLTYEPLSREALRYYKTLARWAATMGIDSHKAAGRLDRLRVSWPRMIDAQNAYLNKRRPPPTEVPGPSRKVLL